MISELVPQKITISRSIDITTEAMQAFLDGGGEIVADHYGITVHGVQLLRYEADMLLVIEYSDRTLINCKAIRGRVAPSSGVPIAL